MVVSRGGRRFLSLWPCFTIWSFSMVNCIWIYPRCFKYFTTKHKWSYLLFLDFFFYTNRWILLKAFYSSVGSNHVSCFSVNWSYKIISNHGLSWSAVLKGDVSIVMQGNLPTSRRYRSYFDVTNSFTTQIWLTPSQKTGRLMPSVSNFPHIFPFFHRNTAPETGGLFGPLSIPPCYCPTWMWEPFKRRNLFFNRCIVA